jgi:two-component system, NarL family, response regulator DevR
MALSKDPGIRLLIVDDHEVLRFGLKKLVETTGFITVVGEAGTVTAALDEAERLKPDVILMDVRLPDGSGAEVCRAIRTVCTQTRILFFTSFNDETAVLAAVFGGAQGYLLKTIPGDALIQAIKSVAMGDSILDPAVTKGVLTRMRSLSRHSSPHDAVDFSLQQRRVLALVAEGQSNKEIAHALNLSERTVRNYLNHIYKKLHVHSRTKAALLFSSRVS